MLCKHLPIHIIQLINLFALVKDYYYSFLLSKYRLLIEKITLPSLAHNVTITLALEKLRSVSRYFLSYD